MRLRAVAYLGLTILLGISGACDTDDDSDAESNTGDGATATTEADSPEMLELSEFAQRVNQRCGQLSDDFDQALENFLADHPEAGLDDADRPNFPMEAIDHPEDLISDEYVHISIETIIQMLDDLRQVAPTGLEQAWVELLDEADSTLQRVNDVQDLGGNDEAALTLEQADDPFDEFAEALEAESFGEAFVDCGWT